MVLIDTSSWIEALRKQGRADVRQRVEQLLAEGEAAWCDLVRVELWNGARGDAERQVLLEMERLVANLPTDSEVWRSAVQLAQQARAGGLTVPAADLVITACARRYGVTLEHCDRHMANLTAI